MNQSRVVSERSLRLAAVMPVAPLPAESLEAKQQQAGHPRRDHDEPLLGPPSWSGRQPRDHSDGEGADKSCKIRSAHQAARSRLCTSSSHRAGRGDASVSCLPGRRSRSIPVALQSSYRVS
jgi:hypothetical protein